MGTVGGIGEVGIERGALLLLECAADGRELPLHGDGWIPLQRQEHRVGDGKIEVGLLGPCNGGEQKQGYAKTARRTAEKWQTLRPPPWAAAAGVAFLKA